LIEVRELNTRTLGMLMVTNPTKSTPSTQASSMHGAFSGEIYSSGTDLILSALEHMFELT